jgi:hypothetical protein
MQCPENLRLMDTLDSGQVNGFIGLKDVYKTVYLSMYRKLPCFKFLDKGSLIFAKEVLRFSTRKKTDVLDASPAKQSLAHPVG